MNAVSGLIILLSLIANCHSVPLTEFDIDFQAIREKIEKSVLDCPSNCQKGTNSECQCLYLPHTMNNCTDFQCIEYGLRKLNFVCNDSDPETHKTCRVLMTLKNLVISEHTLCGMPLSQKPFLKHIKMVYQRSNSNR